MEESNGELDTTLAKAMALTRLVQEFAEERL